MIVVTQSNDVYEISSKYDPNVIYHIKNIPGRRWIPERKVWTIPRSRLGFLINEFKGTSYESSIKIYSDEDLNINQTLDPTAAIPNIDISKIPFYIKNGSKPYKHQYDFMKFAIDRQIKGNFSGFLLADDQGLGKSIQAINLALYNKQSCKFKHCLILCCINSSKFNWLREVEEHCNGIEYGYILGTRLRRDGSKKYNTGNKERYQDLVTGHMYGDKSQPELPYFLILNIEAIRFKKGKTYQIADQIINYINKSKINMIVLDEVHKNVSPSSLQGKQLLRIKKLTGRNAEWLPMTGTPITNKPTDVFLPLKLVDAHSFNSYYKWCEEFCMYGGFGGYEIVGYKNIDKLKQILQNNMLRRLKVDVLDLPPKLHFTEYVENTEYQNMLYSKILTDIKNNEFELMTMLNPLVKFLKLRQVNGNPELVDNNCSVNDPEYVNKNAKLKRLLELLEEIHERKEKVVIFSNWVECLRTLYNFVSKTYKVCCFTGTMKPDVRQQHKDVFQNNPNYTVLLGTIGALGTTHTLTAARNVIFYDLPWNPSDKEQAEDRIYRIGTKDSVNIYTLISQNTVDDKVNQILFNKSTVSKYIVDNKLDIKNNTELLNILLS